MIKAAYGKSRSNTNCHGKKTQQLSPEVKGKDKDSCLCQFDTIAQGFFFPPGQSGEKKGIETKMTKGNYFYSQMTSVFMYKTLNNVQKRSFETKLTKLQYIVA